SRLAASPTSTPSRANDTTDGRSTRPSASGITRGSPVVSSTYPTRLFVVPRSMPTIRDIAFLALAEGIVQVVDDRAEIGSDRERFLYRRERALPLRGSGGVPLLAERPDEPRLFVPQPRRPAIALGDACDRVTEGAVGGVQPRRGLERSRLLLGWRRLMEVGVVPPRQLVESPLQLRRVDGEPPWQPEHLEVVHPAHALRLTPSK